MAKKLKYTECSICGKKGIKLFGLPRHEVKRKKWLALLKREDLIELDTKYLYNNGRVCVEHFQEWAFTSSLKDRLIKNALPNSDPPPVPPIFDAKSYEVVKKPQYRVLKLSKAHIEELKKKEGKIIWNREGTTKPSRFTGTTKLSRFTILREKGQSKQPSCLLTSVDRNSEQPSSSASVVENCDQQSSLTSVDRNSDQPNSRASVVGNCDQPSLQASVVGNCDQPSSPASSIGGNCDLPSSPPSIDENCDQLTFPTVKLENVEQPSLSFSVIKPSNTSLPKSSSVTGEYKLHKKKAPKSSPVSGEYKLNKHIFTKNAQHDQSHLYKLIASQRKEINNQRSVIKKLRKKVDALEKENLSFQKTVMDQLNTERYGFLKSLIKQLGAKNKAMRWSDKDKEFAYACYVLSPQVYKMLRFKLGFPSKSTLKRQILEKSGKSAKQASKAVNVKQELDESNGAMNQTSESNRGMDHEMDETNASFVEMSETGGTLEVDESTMAVNHLMGQGQTLQVNESTGAFFQFIESMESMNESQIREVVEIIESVP